MNEKTVKTGVLVIGAGGAGLRAAIAAHSEGADVTVVSKGAFPSGCSVVCMGVMLAPFDEKDSPQRHLEDTIRGGSGINNRRLAKILTDRAKEGAQDLDRFGTRFEKQDGQYRLFPFTASAVPRGVSSDKPYRGGYIRGLVQEVQRLGIPVLDHVMITDLIKEAGSAAGAAGIGLNTDTFYAIRAKSVILASGGGGNLFSLTTNPAGITGDGFALAYRAGAKLQDMEFVQSRVSMIYPDSMRGTPPPGDGLVTLGGRFYNGLCERYMKKYDPEKLELVTQAQMSICAQREIRAGRKTLHGGVYGDLSDVPTERLQKFEAFMKACAEENFDPTWQPYEWAPGAHHFMGGVVVDEQCETSVPGLYAAGEVVGGIHGANRLAGNALTDTQVFGALAGKHAAKKALASAFAPMSQGRADEAKARIETVLQRKDGIDPAEVKDEITETMSTYVGVIRDEEGLQKAAGVLEDVRTNKIDKLKLSGDRSFEALAGLLETENLLLAGSLVVKAATLRTETRGAHNRDDYPDTDDKWEKNIVLHLENGRTVATMTPIVKEEE